MERYEGNLEVSLDLPAREASLGLPPVEGSLDRAAVLDSAKRPPEFPIGDGERVREGEEKKDPNLEVDWG